MLAPIAKWYDGSNMDGKADLGAYFRFSESARTAEDIGIGISKKGTASSQKRREAACSHAHRAFPFPYGDGGHAAYGSSGQLGAGRRARMAGSHRVRGVLCAASLAGALRNRRGPDAAAFAAQAVGRAGALACCKRRAAHLPGDADE